MMSRGLFPLLVCALIVGGCAEMRWTRSGADAAMVSRDIDDCRASALRRANAPVSTPGQSDRTDGVGRPHIMTPSSGSDERFVAEHEEVSRCMHQRGYQLRPAS